jgi:hypothetical protein
LKSNAAQIAYVPRSDATHEAELSALSAVYRYVLFDSQARRGDPHDLTNSSTAEMAKNGPRKTEQEKT